MCSLCSESNNANLLPRLSIAILGTSILLHVANTRNVPINDALPLKAALPNVMPLQS